MSPCRVLYVAKTAKGGSAFSLYYLVKGLDRSRYEPIVLFYVQESTYPADKLAALDVKTVALSLPRNYSPPSAQPVGHRDIARALDGRFGVWSGQAYTSLKRGLAFLRSQARKVWPIVRAIREHDIDLVHVNAGLLSGKPGILAAQRTGKPCICHVRTFDELTPFDRSFARFVTQFIYISGAVAQGYIDQGISADRSVVIHNAVDLSEFSTEFDATDARREFGWSADDRVIGVIGRLDWWKGHEYFLEAMARLVSQIPSLKGLVIGEPEHGPLNDNYYRRLLALTRFLGLEDRVIFTGFRGDVPRLMSALDVVVLSSAAPEPFGRVVIDGMAAGKPVVATAAGGVLEIIEDGITGILVPPQDSAALADAVMRLLSDREWSQRIGAAARRSVEERFTLHQHAAAVQQVYDALGVKRKNLAAGKRRTGPESRTSRGTLHHTESGRS
ncbi:MAG TPA: glycosyltransferase family 4 protein [Anaerolineae bacterium]|nr:glycosyltransferase family 4 protein [Anaerolineae bacterium]